MNVVIFNGRRGKRIRFKRYMSASIPIGSEFTMPLLSKLPMGENKLNEDEILELIRQPMTKRQSRVFGYALQKLKEIE
jgi:hypothetical protein